MSRPRPVPDAVSGFYWEAAARGELAVLVCAACGLAHHPPEVACPHCGADALEPRVSRGTGRVFAACVVRQAFDVDFAEAVPYALALVELDDHPDVRVLTNVDGASTDDPVPVGTPVAVTFVVHDDWVLPQFRVVEA